MFAAKVDVLRPRSGLSERAQSRYIGGGIRGENNRKFRFVPFVAAPFDDNLSHSFAQLQHRILAEWDKMFQTEAMFEWFIKTLTRAPTSTGLINLVAFFETIDSNRRTRLSFARFATHRAGPQQDLAIRT